MTPTLIKCPECGLANWTDDPNCKRCKFAFQPETSVAGAIRMPSQSLPESSFADLYEPDDGGFIPSHSQTPQMTARMAAVRQSAGQNQKYDQFLTPQAEIRQLPPENPAPHVFREDSSSRVVDSLIPVKPKNGIAVASMILGIIGLLTAILLVGFLFALIGLILGIVALVKISKKPMIYGGKAFAIAGIALSVLTVLTLPIVASITIPNLLAARRVANESRAITVIEALPSVETIFMMGNITSKCADLK